MEDQRTAGKAHAGSALRPSRAGRSAASALALLITMRLTVWILAGPLGKAVPGRGAGDRENPERGDVPGWVMVTLMTAALVALLLAVAGPALEGLFKQAIDTVTKK